ncbi:MAG: ferrochelatase [Halodesulfurarchaeum sp.]
MDTVVVLLNFGEPAEPTRESVLPYLERIFFDNASLERFESEADARERARELAERRVDGLLEEYATIGGSPLDEQARSQAEQVRRTLADRGFEPVVEVAMQYTDPLIEDVAISLAKQGITRVIALPVYPLSGPSTNIGAVDDLEAAINAIDSDIDLQAVTGWHRHPVYTRLRVENVASYLEEAGLSLEDPGTELFFSAHGTPTSYLEDGSRYDQYVGEHTETVARLLGVETYTLGYQNHASRSVSWTEPDVETALQTVEADRVVVEPTSFLHEQSETLHELDVELAEEAEKLGLDFYRVPVPHDDQRLGSIVADLLEPFLADFDPRTYQLRACQCRNESNTYCLNAPCM